MAAKTQTCPIHVLCGKDAFLLAETRKRILRDLLGDADPQLCVSQFESDAELAAVLDELRTLPFLAPRRVVVLRDAEAFVSTYREALEAYFDAPIATATLILEVGSWPSNTKLARKLKTVGELVECSGPEGAALPGWIRNAVQERGKKIRPEAVNLLAEWIGPNPACLNSELDKLTAYVGDKATIEPADIAAVVSASGSPEAFAVTNAVTAGNVKAALEAVTAAMTSRGAEFALLGQLAWHLRRALQVAQAVAKGQNPAVAAREARVFHGQQEFLAMIRRRGLASLQNDFRKLLAADLGMKSGIEPIPAMQTLVADLCRTRNNK